MVIKGHSLQERPEAEKYAYSPLRNTGITFDDLIAGLEARGSGLQLTR
jgi:hypothetical protein